MISLMQDDRLTALRAKIPAFADAIHISLLEGGLTNKNYRVDTASGSYVMRISNKADSMLGINRENERVNTGKAHQAGIGPEVIDSLPDENVLVIRWIEAKTLHAADFQSNPILLPAIANALLALHHTFICRIRV